MQFQDELAGGIVLVRPALQSPDYQAGSSGWAIKIDGSAEFNNIVIRGGGTSDPVVVGNPGSPQVIIRTSAGNGLIVFPTNRPIEQDAATVGSAVVNSGAANERAELQLTGPTVNGAPLGVRLVLSSRPQNATDVARFSVQDRTGATVFFTVDGDQVLATGRPLVAERAATTDNAFRVRVTGEAQPRLNVVGDGSLQWGPGTAGADTNLYRAAAGILQTDNTFVVLGEFDPRNLVRGIRPNATDSMYESRATGDTNARWFTRANGETWWGTGAAVQDVRLYRSAASTLAVGGNLTVDQDLAVTGNQTITGAITAYSSWTTFVPTWNNVGTATFSTNIGWYKRVDDIWLFEIYTVASAAGSGTTAITISNLPFNPFRAGNGAATTRQRMGAHLGGVAAGTNSSVAGSFTALCLASGAASTIDRLTGPTAIDLRGENISATFVATIQGYMRST